MRVDDGPWGGDRNAKQHRLFFPSAALLFIIHRAYVARAPVSYVGTARGGRRSINRSFYLFIAGVMRASATDYSVFLSFSGIVRT